MNGFFQAADKALFGFLRIRGQNDGQQKKAIHLFVVYLEEVRHGRASSGSFTVDELCSKHIHPRALLAGSCVDGVDYDPTSRQENNQAGLNDPIP